MTFQVSPPTCPHHPKCPGCPHLSLPSYATSLEQKQSEVEQALRRAALTPQHPIQLAGAELLEGWRTRARYVVNTKASHADELLGFYAQGTRDLVPISRCLAHRPLVEDALTPLKRVLFEMTQLKDVTAYVEARAFGSERVDVTLCLRGTPEQEAKALVLAKELEAKAFGQDSELEGPKVVLWVRTGGKGAAVGNGQLNGVTSQESNAVQVRLATSGRAVEVPVGAFFQQHPEQLDVAHQLMCEWLQEKPSSVLDLYCGVGVHGLGLLAPGGALLATDMHQASMDSLQRSVLKAQDLSLQSKAASDAQVDSWLDAHVSGVDVAVTNPGRAGMHPEVTSWLMGQGRQAIGKGLVYMSCHLPTLVRDLVRLTRDGSYQLERVAVLDMMPWTNQVEVVAMLRPVTAPEVSSVEIERAFDFGAVAPPRRLSVGVSGVPLQSKESTWVAVVSGKVPKQGKLPTPPIKAGLGQAQVTCIRVFSMGVHYSGVRLICEGECSDEQLRQRMRGWGYPVVGDLTYGIRKINRRAKLKFHLDRMLLHCSSVDVGSEEHFAGLDRDWPWEFWHRFDSEDL